MEYKNLITLTQLPDMSSYFIETNQEEILRFKQKGAESMDDVYSPESLTFKVFNSPRQSEEQQLVLENNNYVLEILTAQGFLPLAGDFLTLGFNTGVESSQVTDINTVYFNTTKFANYVKSLEGSEVEKDNNIRNAFSSNPVFRFSYVINRKIQSSKTIQLRNGVSDNMAKLNVHASGIDASIQSGRLAFSANGLEIYNEANKVFWADEHGSLHLVGNLEAAGGTFNGTLDAVDGTFTGTLSAPTGNIGGLTISENALFAGENIDTSSLRIYGSGEIYANNITLGIGATIESHIKLGNAYLRKPDTAGGIVLEGGGFKLYDNGNMQLGNIDFYGGIDDEGNNAPSSSYIKAGDESSSAAWEIKGDGTATFKNIIADKATIRDTVLEVGTVQAVGSTMLFKDSWKIKSVDGKNILEIDATDINSMSLESEDYVIDTKGNYYKIESKDSENSKLILNSSGLQVGDIITKIGSQNDYIISISGESNPTSSDFASGNSLTMAKVEMDEGDTKPSFKKILVLGDLTKLGDSTISGTGLYAENVHLHGMLTTKTSGNNYAGINTSGSVTSSILTDDTTIVFWAGSDDTSSIGSAKFHVTENGSLYASQGVFEGSIITRARIEGSEIHTAKIYGEGTDGAALKIYDAVQGIQFINKRLEANESETNESEVTETVKFGISSDGLYTQENSNLFISLGNDQIDYKGYSAVYNKGKDATILMPNSIGFSKAWGSDIQTETIQPAAEDEEGLQISVSKIPQATLEFNDSFSFKLGNEEKFNIGSMGIVSTSKATFQQQVQFGIDEQSGTMTYQKVDSGYNLFVS